MFKLTVRVNFSAAHRLKYSKSDCAFLHGHNYKLLVYYEGDLSPTSGMVEDFKEIESNIAGYVLEKFDHSIIISSHDTEMLDVIGEISPKKIALVDGEPTAEVIVNDIAKHIRFLALESDFYKGYSELELWETDKYCVSLKLY